MKVEQYFRPVQLADALEILSIHNPRVKILAGGTDLLIQINEREIRPKAILDIGAIEELKDIRYEDGILEIGSMATFSQLEKHDLIRKHCPILAMAAGVVGSPQIRTTATVGGNFVNGAAAADSVPVLLAMKSQVLLAGKKGSRTLDVEKILTAQACIEPDEVAVKFLMPIPAGEAMHMGFEKIGRRKALAIARINIAVVYRKDAGKLQDVRIALGAVGKAAYRAYEVETFLTGKALSPALVAEGADYINQLVGQQLGSRPTAPYKKKIAAAVFKRALEANSKGGIS